MGCAGASNQSMLRYYLNHPEVRPHRLRGLARLVVWLLVRRFGRRPRTIRWVGGSRLRWYSDSVSVGNAWLFGLIEWRDMRFVLDALRPGDFFVDVGANVGVYSILATRTPDVDVLAFEPGLPARNRLEEHVRLNQLQDRVEVLPYVLSERDGEIAFSVGKDVVNHVVTTEAATGVERLAARRLDDLVPSDGPAARPMFVKIDVEGHEAAVLRGAAQLLASRRPVLIIEWNDRSVRDILEPLGYRSYVYSPDTRELVESDWQTAGTSNVLAIADVEPIRARLREAHR